MGFWGGLLIGLFIGANVGLFVACLFGNPRRDKTVAVIENDLGSGEFVRWASEQMEKTL
jgi:hypothetical protein